MFDICIDIDLDELSNELSKKFINTDVLKRLYKVRSYNEESLLEIERCVSWDDIQYKIEDGIVSIRHKTQNLWL